MNNNVEKTEGLAGELVLYQPDETIEDRGLTTIIRTEIDPEYILGCVK